MPYCHITIPEYTGSLQSDMQIDYLPMFKEYTIDLRDGTALNFKTAKACHAKAEELKKSGLKIPSTALKWIKEESIGPYGKRIWWMIHVVFLVLIAINALSAVSNKESWVMGVNLIAGLIVTYFYISTLRSVHKGWKKILTIRRK